MRPRATSVMLVAVLAAASARPQIDQQITWFYAKSLDKGSAFLGDVVGLNLTLDQGPCRIFQAAPAHFLGVCDSRPAPDIVPPVTYTLVVSSRDAVDAWHAYTFAARICRGRVAATPWPRRGYSVETSPATPRPRRGRSVETGRRYLAAQGPSMVNVTDASYSDTYKVYAFNFFDPDALESLGLYRFEVQTFESAWPRPECDPIADPVATEVVS